MKPGKPRSTASSNGNSLDAKRFPGLKAKTKDVSSGDALLVRRSSLAKSESFEEIRNHRGHLCLLDSSNDSSFALSLGRRIATVNTIAIIPETESAIRQVFHLSTNSNLELAMRRMGAAKRRWENLENVSVISESGATRQASLLQSKIRESSSQGSLTIVFGHNENGYLRFPDRSKLEIAALYREANRNGSQVVILSCETAKHIRNADGIATTKRLEFIDTAEAITAVEKRLRQSEGSLTLGEVVQTIEASMNRSSGRSGRRIKVAVSSGGVSVLILLILELLTDDDESNED
ncbi:hypothetical protein [Fuerstiella marisgermanici]|nr:hypothetical protein [Fuerstiella marisgermanici]